jgi:hypothetical protein
MHSQSELQMCNNIQRKDKKYYMGILLLIYLQSFKTRLGRGLRSYATSWKVVGSSPDEVIEYFSIYLILPVELGPGVYSASNRNECQKQKKIFLGSRARPTRKADTSSPSVSCLTNVGASKSHNPKGLHGLLQAQLYHFFFTYFRKPAIEYLTEEVSLPRSQKPSSGPPRATRIKPTFFRTQRSPYCNKTPLL